MNSKVAYFTMEIALSDNIHTFSGGLGVLAGDAIKSCADLNLPIVAITLLSKKGYFRQELSCEGRQLEHPYPWDPSQFMQLLPQTVKVPIQGHDVNVRAWVFYVKSLSGGQVPVYFLDTDFENNLPEDREITAYLYGGDQKYRLKQEIVLGIGGLRILDALEIPIHKYHLNEGHSSLLTLELLRKNQMDKNKVRDICVFTTHTPTEAGHDRFSYSTIQDILGDSFPLELLKKYSNEDKLDMTMLAMNLSSYINGVSKKHRDVTKAMFPNYDIHAITNGIHSYSWTCKSFRKLYSQYLPDWINEPEMLVRVSVIPDDKIWQAHKEAKKELIDYINMTTKAGMDYDTFTIGFARRATEYKRPTLLFSDLDKLRKISSKGKIQIILAGKAHPRDGGGKNIIEQIFCQIKKLKDEIKIVYLENYDMTTASKLVSGVDIWLNTPLIPQEASGTSGMKAAVNGVINFSVLDGWWVEGWIEGITGFAIGPKPDLQIPLAERREKEMDDLYNKLEYVILPMYYNRNDEWVKLMKNSIEKLAYYFNSHRMMRQYVADAYF